MKILFISSSPLNKEISIGNTFLNLFENMEDVELASICTRNGFVDKKISRTFRITEKSVLKNILKNTPVGIEIKNSQPEVPEHNEDAVPNKYVSFVKKFRCTFFFLVQNFIWRIGKWKSSELEDFINSYAPDIIFTVFSNSRYLNRIILYVKKVSKAKLVLYAWDNNYSMKQFWLSPLRWLNHFFDRKEMRKTAKAADLFYVISETQKRDYEKSFKKEFKLLTKSSDFDEEAEYKSEYNFPLQFVYTGNVGMNRWKSLAHIANVLEKINADGIKAQLRIYTGNDLTEKMLKSLNKKDTSFVMGRVPQEEVLKIQNDADMLVHIESVDLKNKLLVRQSFSTKIVDYFKSGRPILAYGPKDVASVEHLIQNDCAVFADNESDLFDKLNEVINDNNKLTEIAVKGYECGKKYHNKSDYNKMIIEDLNKIIKN